MLAPESTSIGSPDSERTSATGSPRGVWSRSLVAALLAVVLLLSAIIAVGLGQATIDPIDTARYLWAALTGGTIRADEVSAYQIVWQIRTPRVLLAACVGAGLGAVGIATQALVRNPLADPFILGVSSGAAVGAVTVSTFGALSVLGIYALSVGAFAGAIGAAIVVYLISSGTGLVPLRLVLTGVAMSFGFQALMSVIVYLAPNSEATATVLFWSMGSFGAATWGSLPVVVAIVILGVVLLLRQSHRLDVLSLSDETAASLGVDPTRSRRMIFVLTAVMTGAMVATSGAIGFVGLVMPHLVRLVAGATHATVLTLTPLVSAIFMVWVDVLGRTVVAPRELPIGVLTALVGVPVFVTLIRRRAYAFGGR